MISGKTILVTGGAGFVGSHIADHLVEDNDVYVLDNLTSGDPDNVPDGAELVVDDIRNAGAFDSVPDADVVFHQAALVSVPASIDEPTRSHAINVAGSLNVLEYARDVDARVVLASSTAVYGDASTLPTPESEPITPNSPYGIDKATVDRYARTYHELYGVETVALRYFNIYGPRQGGEYSGVISIFLEKALNDDPITVHGDGSQTRDFVHVDDVVQANLLAATTEHVGEAYNVGTGREVSVRELAETIREVTGSDSEIVYTESREGDIDRSVADLGKAREKLGYVPRVGVSEGLAGFVKSQSEQIPQIQ
ncbi:NAD-dependent epimerase/dehydratase family protein [Halogranum rubrum]|uniref:NAD-dependent epimerase/dehydratase n=1 Tax=Halogranum salarium B-1 TaxID=1210908 RepID=J2ZB94_9EURY|nr:NAD-dependent epimerase/dehydratase family protein [Halogranum salarium]EJN57925.1 NAD-dependent epimerase/dehydratase [Halogranum salarium B-1]